MVRLMWAMAAVILCFTGWDLVHRGLLGWSGYGLIGVGTGIGIGVVGSLAHDALASPRGRV